MSVSQPAFAVTDYVFFVVNGDTTSPALTQGDTLAWGANCDLGSAVRFEIWYDVNSNGIINELGDVILESSISYDGISPTDATPEDGIILSESIMLSLPPGMYIFKAMNLTDSTSTERTIVNSVVPSPPNRIQGHITIPGVTAPDALLANVFVFSEYQDAQGPTAFGALTDTDGFYDIRIPISGSGLSFGVEPSPITGFSSPVGRLTTVSGTVTDFDFAYKAAVDSVYGYLRDDDATILNTHATVECDNQYPDTLYKEVHFKNNRYAIYFAADELSAWEMEVDEGDLFYDYIVPYGLQFDQDTVGSFQYDFTVIRPDTSIYVRILENGGAPSNRYIVFASSYILNARAANFTNLGADNISTIHASTTDPANWTVWLDKENDDFPIPAPLILRTDTYYNISPGDTVTFDLIDGTLVTGTVQQDPEDDPINWEEMFVSAWSPQNKNAGVYVGDGGLYELYVDTGEYYISAHGDNHTSLPAWHHVIVTEDTSGFDFILNNKHCRVSGSVVNIPLPLDASYYTVAAFTGTGGLDGYYQNAYIDSATGTYTLYLCDGDWSIRPPDFTNFTTPSNAQLTIGEAPDTVRTLNFTYNQDLPCGDANADGSVNLGDAVYLINYIFRGGAAPNPLCLGKVNLDGDVNLGDAVYLINYIFRGGAAPITDCCP
ncbi:MAG: dockerin type I repeat-containing protein [Candidatus Zixiibacteriota bacterium]